KRMILREGTFALKTGSYGCGQQLGQVAEFIPRAGIMHSLSGINYRPLRTSQHGRRPLDFGRIWTEAAGLCRLIVERLRHLFVPYIGRNLDHDRATAPVAQARKGTAENIGYFGGGRNRVSQFGDVPHVQYRVEVRRHVRNTPRISAGQDQQRDRLAISLGNAAKGILRTGSMLHREHADGAPAAEARNRIGHMESGAFLANDYWTDAGRGRILQDVINRVANYDLDSFAL